MEHNRSYLKKLRNFINFKQMAYIYLQMLVYTNITKVSIKIKIENYTYLLISTRYCIKSVAKLSGLFYSSFWEARKKCAVPNERNEKGDITKGNLSDLSDYSWQNVFNPFLTGYILFCIS